MSASDHTGERITVWRCPECRSMRFPDGSEAEYGPPECSHGLMFGVGPDGGGESEMEPYGLVPVAGLTEWVAQVWPRECEPGSYNEGWADALTELLSRISAADGEADRG